MDSCIVADSVNIVIQEFTVTKNQHFRPNLLWIANIYLIFSYLKMHIRYLNRLVVNIYVAANIYIITVLYMGATGSKKGGGAPLE